MKIEKVHETRGVKRTELTEYFSEIGTSEKGGIYYGEGWWVWLEEEKTCQLGSISLPEVRITFYAQEDVYHEMISAFRLKFLRAGG